MQNDTGVNKVYSRRYNSYKGKINLQFMNIDYPKTRKVDQEDDFHGNLIKDPYRWLESHEGDEIQDWITEQNKLVDTIISKEKRLIYAQELKKLSDYTKYSVPQVHNGFWFYTKNDGLQPQAIHYYKEGLESEPKILLDPNELSETNTIFATEKIFTKDASLVAISLSEDGSDWNEVKIMDVKSGAFLGDKIVNVRNGSGIQWLSDNTGFYYTAFIGKEDTVGSSKLWFHKIGDDQFKDQLIFDHPDEEMGVSCRLTEDENYIFLYLWNSTLPQNLVWFADRSTLKWVKLVDIMEFRYIFLGNDNEHVYFFTNDNAENSKVIKIDINHPEKENWVEIIPENENAIPRTPDNPGVTLSNGKIYVSYMKNVANEILVYDLDGKYLDEIKLPQIGRGGIFGRLTSEVTFVLVQNFLQPQTVYQLNHEDLSLNLVFEKASAVVQTEYQIKQIFYESKDGTKVPMFIIHKHGIELNGSNPTLLYAYGGFNIPQLPYYKPMHLAWVNKGGIFALANIRGGGEFGKRWHFSGILENKQTVFNDFIAAAEWLITNNYTTSQHLAINGRSNGGLLVGACVLQRPDLYGAVLCHVGVLDMLRYHKYSIGRYWTTEYGHADNPDHFKFMIKYSPLHNVKPIEYPPILVHTAETDDRVDPANSKKFAATLQNVGKGGPLLLRVVKNAGHGMGKPIDKLIEDESYDLAFIDQFLKK